MSAGGGRDSHHPPGVAYGKVGTLHITIHATIQVRLAVNVLGCADPRTKKRE
jgi:hypothetical protein